MTTSTTEPTAPRGPTAPIIERCQSLYDDLRFTEARRWKEAEPGRKVIGYLPIYVPRELIHAAGMLPLGIFGGGDGLEVIHGDAYYQSYICRIPRSTIELGVTGRLDFVDGMLFPSICDVIRNLSGMWKLMFPHVYARYFDVPQNYQDAVGGTYYVHELEELKRGLEKVGGRTITDDALRSSIAVFNDNRRAVQRLYDFRSERPWLAPGSDVYLLIRAGTILPVEEHTRMVHEYIAAAEKEARPKRDNARVVVTGAFCEQPPLNLVKSIEMAGCYIVDDDFMLGTRWLLDEVKTTGAPLEALSDAFLHHSAATAARYEETAAEKGLFLIGSAKKTRAEGVLFAAPSFCDPALLERPMLQNALKKHAIPYTAFKYAENSGQMQPIREQAGTFADSIKLWSET